MAGPSLRVLLVGNPTAQSGKAEARIEKARAAMVGRGWSVDLQPTAPGGATVTQVARRLDEGGFDVVVYLGGDGTFREVAQAVLQSDAKVHMGMLPAGTANDQGKSFGVSARPRALEKNLDVIDQGHVIQLDVGQVERLDDSARALFFDSVGFGFQAEVLARRNVDRATVETIPVVRELYRDTAVYAGATLKKWLSSFVEPTKFDAHIVADGKDIDVRRVVDVVIKATAVYGGQWVLDRRNRPDDGLFELVMFYGRTDALFKALFDRKETAVRPADLLPPEFRPDGEAAQAAAFDLTFSRANRPGILSQIDGEEWLAGDRFRVEVIEAKVPLIVPAAFKPAWRTGR